MNCIFCNNNIEKESIEHIVPESLGNERYILKPNCLCGDCNNSFSKFEAEAISKTILGFERARLGIKTKKGKPSIGEVQDIKFTAHDELKKNYITAHGIKSEHIVGTNEKDRTFQVKVPAFDNNAMATSKLILKIGFESIYQSKKCFIKEFDFNELKNYLLKKDNKDWPFITSRVPIHTFKSIPSFFEKYSLKRIECYLNYLHLDSKTILFQFKYGGAHFVLNLLNRNTDWAKEYFAKDKNARLYPEYLMKKQN